jgi:hypothetical protein
MNVSFTKPKRNKGAAMLISVIFFLFISLAIISALVAPTVRIFRNANVNLNSKKSYFLAESGSEDALYRILNNMTIGNSEVLTLNGNSATTTISTTFGNGKQISTLADVASLQIKTNLSLTTGVGVSFNYGLQVGNGGVTIDGGSTINGNIYSNSSINAISATINGSAIAADSPTLAIDQSNATPTTPTGSINFRNVSAAQDFAQSFQVASSSPINKVQFYIKKVGAPADATVRLVADNAGVPSTTVIPIGSVSLSAASVSAVSYGWAEVDFTSFPSLIPGTTYWIVIDNGTQNASNYYVIGANADSSYVSGTAKTGVYSGSWSVANLDSYFKIYTGGVPSLIGGAGYAGGVTIGTGGVGDAWATTVKGATVAGHLYCTTGANNSKACDTTHGAVPSVGLPFTDADVTNWKNTAAAGGIITGATKCPGGSSGGNCIVNSVGATFGPGEITGNLTVNGGGTLTLTGTLWVVGNITITGGGKIILPANYGLNSETIVSDNWVNISGGGSAGSGNSKSYLFIVSTSRCPYDTYCAGKSAMTVSGGAGAIAVDAQNGDVLLNGGANFDGAVGNSMTVTGGAIVNYNTGLASPAFSNGPSGGWNIGGWGESQ